VVGIGETGLDYFRDHSPRVRQEESFREHIRSRRSSTRRWSSTTGTPTTTSWRSSTDEGAPERTVFHCFSGGVDLVKRCAEEGWFMSFAGNVTFSNAPNLREAAAAAPLELLVTETDSPYLSPHPHRGTTNEPARVPLVVAQLAELHGVPTEEMAARTTSQRPSAVPPARAGKPHPRRCATLDLNLRDGVGGRR
jgi:TatD DNase family protein